MWKALVRKQFLELNQTYFQDRKTGKRRSKGKLIGFIVLMLSVFLLLAGMFFVLGMSIVQPLAGMGLSWLYFAMIGLLSLLLGVFGDVFNTYAGLYHAKDNELLLSMPIPPVKILSARLIGVYAMGLLYEGLVWIPGSAAYWIFTPVTAAGVILPLLLFLVLGFFVSTLTCALGYVVALIASKLKNRSAVTAVLALVFLAAYYVLYFKASDYLQDLLVHADSLSGKVKTAAWPLYQLGLAGSGSWGAFAIVLVMVAVLFALTVYILSHSFIRIATANSGVKRKEYKEKKKSRTRSAARALFHKELKRFTSSATYMLNCGLGLVILLALGVFLLIRRAWFDDLLLLVYMGMPELTDFFPLAIVCAVMLAGGMNVISAPSVSLEGKNLWLVQSLPVEPRKVLFAKENLHMALNVVPVVFCTIALGVVVRLSALDMVCVLLFSLVFVWFSADFGLVLNLWKPNLSWTNETVPVKQGASVMLALFGSWILAALFAAGGWFSRNVLLPQVYFLICLALLAAITVWMHFWLRTKGAKIFAEL